MRGFWLYTLSSHNRKSGAWGGTKTQSMMSCWIGLHHVWPGYSSQNHGAQNQATAAHQPAAYNPVWCCVGKWTGCRYSLSHSRVLPSVMQPLSQRWRLKSQAHVRRLSNSNVKEDALSYTDNTAKSEDAEGIFAISHFLTWGNGLCGVSLHVLSVGFPHVANGDTMSETFSPLLESCNL